MVKVARGRREDSGSAAVFEVVGVREEGEGVRAGEGAGEEGSTVEAFRCDFAAGEMDCNGDSPFSERSPTDSESSESGKGPC